MSDAVPFRVRLGTPDDIAEIVRLREVMYLSMAEYHDDGEWASGCAAQLRERLGRDDDVAVVVADHPSVAGRLVASGAGIIGRRLPGPGNPSGRLGYIQSIVTDEEFRRQGLAHAVFAALMAWFGERGVRRVDLHATPDGARIYREYGFTEGPTVELRWRAPDEACT